MYIRDYTCMYICIYTHYIDTYFLGQERCDKNLTQALQERKQAWNDHEASSYLDKMTMELNHNSILKDKYVKV